MRLRASRALTIILLLASASPAPRVVNVLIAGASHRDSTEARKSIQARGRHRIGSPARLDAHLALACLPGGNRKSPAPSIHSYRRQEIAKAIDLRANPSPTSHANLRLRC